MKTFKERLPNLSFYLQSLTAPDIFPKIQKAVASQDRHSLVKVCRKAKIPEMYMGNVVSVLLSVGPEQKWPALF